MATGQIEFEVEEGDPESVVVLVSPPDEAGELAAMLRLPHAFWVELGCPNQLSVTLENRCDGCGCTDSEACVSVATPGLPLRSARAAHDPARDRGRGQPPSALTARTAATDAVHDHDPFANRPHRADPRPIQEGLVMTDTTHTPTKDCACNPVVEDVEATAAAKAATPTSSRENASRAHQRTLDRLATGPSDAYEGAANLGFDAAVEQVIAALAEYAEEPYEDERNEDREAYLRDAVSHLREVFCQPPTSALMQDDALLIAALSTTGAPTNLIRAVGRRLTHAATPKSLCRDCGGTS